MKLFLKKYNINDHQNNEFNYKLNIWGIKHYHILQIYEEIHFTGRLLSKYNFKVLSIQRKTMKIHENQT
jgi:hypothetical protein